MSGASAPRLDPVDYVVVEFPAVLGGLIALRLPIGRRPLGLIMALMSGCRLDEAVARSAQRRVMTLPSLVVGVKLIGDGLPVLGG